LKRSLYWKIIVPMILLITVGMTVLGIFSVNSVKTDEYNQLHSYLINEARLSADSVISALKNGAGSANVDSIAKNLGKLINARVTIIAQDGTVLGDSWENPQTMENHSNRPEVISALSSGVGESTRFSTTTNQNMLYVAIPIMDQGKVLGISRVALPFTSVEESVNNSILTLIWATIIAAFLVILATAFITRMITRPIRHLTRAALNITAGDLGRQITSVSADEIGQLGKAFNKMSISLKEKMTAISDEKSKLSTVLISITDGLMMTDREGRILFANPAAEKLFGFKLNVVIDKHLIEATLNYEIDAILKKCLAANQKYKTEIDTTSGKYLRIIAVPITTENLSGALLLVQDLTELRGLQTMRREFVGNVSHELRTPLAGIKAIVETLQDGALQDESVAKEFLNKIENEVDTLTQMVNELIELSRIETGKVKLNEAQFNLNELIENIIGRLNPQAERKQISISAELGKDLPAVRADRERIQQVITNIMHNAIKYTPDSGKIKVKSSKTPEGVTVTFEDTGVGISQADLPHIFERFFKADKSRSTEGSGLGLAISKHIVQAHNGQIWVKSEEGKGSTFGFSLPVK
jgi:two-component system phosphate regulon sensor histidine kinase PhoR